MCLNYINKFQKTKSSYDTILCLSLISSIRRGTANTTLMIILLSWHETRFPSRLRRQVTLISFTWKRLPSARLKDILNTLHYNLTLPFRSPDSLTLSKVAGIISSSSYSKKTPPLLVAEYTSCWPQQHAGSVALQWPLPVSLLENIRGLFQDVSCWYILLTNKLTLRFQISDLPHTSLVSQTTI